MVDINKRLKAEGVDLTGGNATLLVELAKDLAVIERQMNGLFCKFREEFHGSSFDLSFRPITKGRLFDSFKIEGVQVDILLSSDIGSSDAKSIFWAFGKRVDCEWKDGRLTLPKMHYWVHGGKDDFDLAGWAENLEKINGPANGKKE
ncbi:MAG: hypothetical protein WC764_03670 [Candidatus Paceibacterota bacterium]|jgi:hypothetical protein